MPLWMILLLRNNNSFNDQYRHDPHLLTNLIDLETHLLQTRFLFAVTYRDNIADILLFFTHLTYYNFFSLNDFLIIIIIIKMLLLFSVIHMKFSVQIREGGTGLDFDHVNQHAQDRRQWRRRVDAVRAWTAHPYFYF